ncbi:MAG: hypothetical protein AAB468_00115 [Patescibacteria group bacterium]
MVKEKKILAPPLGGRVHIVRVPVIQDLDWQEAINRAGPDTEDVCIVRDIDHLYLPTGTSIKDEEIILLNFGPGGGSWGRALKWSQINNLDRTNPRQVFAIGQHCPHLNHELGFNFMYIVATIRCTFGGEPMAVFLRWADLEREVGDDWLGDFWESHVWFAFCCPVASPSLNA